MKALFILNDAPYGSERSYNALRMAGHISKQEGNEVKVFLIGDGAACARRGQKTPQGFYNIEIMLGSVIRHGGTAGICATCMDARGVADGDLVEGTHRSSLGELSEWTAWADKVLVF